MRSHICLKINLLPTTDIQEAISEAKDLAQHLNLAYVNFNFNGTNMHIGQNANIENTIEEYHTKTKFICSP